MWIKLSLKDSCPCHPLMIRVSQQYLFLLLLFLFLFIYFWLHWVFVAAHRLSLVAVSRGYSLLLCAGFSLWWLLLLQSAGSRRTGLVAPWHVGSSWTRARTRVPCTCRQILNHCATREVPTIFVDHSFIYWTIQVYLAPRGRVPRRVILILWDALRLVMEFVSL